MSLTSPPKREFRDGLERLKQHTQAFSELVSLCVEPIAQVLAEREEKNAPPTAAILPERLRIERRARELKTQLCFEPERRRLVDTIIHIFEYGPTLLSEGAWSVVKEELSRAQKVLQESTLDSLKLSEEFFLSVYILAKTLFERGLYDRSSNILFFLVTLCPACSQFWLAYGLISQRTRHYNIAVNAFLKACELDSSCTNQLHLADCYADMFNKKEAEEILQQCEGRITGDEQDIALAIRAKIGVTKR